MDSKGLIHTKPHRLHHHANCNVSVGQIDITVMKWAPCLKCGCKLRAEMPVLIATVKISQDFQLIAFLKLKSRFNNGM